jgi:hypothetical protein
MDGRQHQQRGEARQRHGPKGRNLASGQPAPGPGYTIPSDAHSGPVSHVIRSISTITPASMPCIHLHLPAGCPHISFCFVNFFTGPRSGPESACPALRAVAPCPHPQARPLRGRLRALSFPRLCTICTPFHGAQNVHNLGKTGTFALAFGLWGGA